MKKLATGLLLLLALTWVGRSKLINAQVVTNYFNYLPIIMTDGEAEPEPTDPDGIDIDLFLDGSLEETPTLQNCRLSDGSISTCYEITIAGYPSNHEVGPFCPETTSDTEETVGIWFDGNGVYDLDGAFILGLADLYNDSNWKLYNDDGSVNVTETAEEFDLAARPNVDPSLQNHCVEGRIEWLDNGEPVPATVLIPAEPVDASSPTVPDGNLGVTLNGVIIAPSAPVDAILSAYTIAAFDDCGGHINPVEGYHLHGARGCSEVGDAVEGETPIFGYALDGYAIHSPLEAADEAAAGLDACQGHTTDADGYHYHAARVELNAILDCYTGLTAVSIVSDDTASGIDVTLFDSDGLAAGPSIVDCTLTDGTETQCAQLVTRYVPDNLEIGPFCPDTIDDVGGIWVWDGDQPGLYQLDDTFFTMLTAQGYNFYDADGNIYIGDPAGSLVPDVNNCLEAAADDTVETTVLIPLEPVMAAAPSDLGTVAQVGLGIDGVPIFADAPSVLDTGHLPALDPCGGHIDPGGWYHWHSTASDVESSYSNEGVSIDCYLDQSTSALFGYAFDGYPMYGTTDEDGTMPTDLDDCSGHIGPTAEYPDGIYHYHAGLDFPNLQSCLVGTSAQDAFTTTADGGAGGGGPGGPGGPPPREDE